MVAATKTPAHLVPTTSGAKPAELTKVTASQWQSLLALSASGKLSGVPPAVLGAIQQAEAPALGSSWSINTQGYGGGFGVGAGPLKGQVSSEADLADQEGAGYDAQAIAAADVFSDGLVANNGNTLAAEFFYQNGGRAYPGVPNNQGKLPTLEGVSIIKSISAIPHAVAKFGNGTGTSVIGTVLGDLSPKGFAASGASTGGAGLSQGAAVPGADLTATETAAAAKAESAAAATATAADKVTAAQSAGGANTTTAAATSAVSGITGDVTKDLEVAGYLLGGVGLVIVGLVLAFKKKSDNTEIGWLALWLGGMVLWATLTKRSPVCVVKSIVSGTDTTACVGTVSGGNLFAGTLTALGGVLAGSALLSAAKGVGSGGGGGGGGGGGSEEPAPEEPTPSVPDPLTDLPIEP